MNHQMQLMHAVRAKTSFDPRQLTYVIYGGEDEVKRRETILERVELAAGMDNNKLPQVYVGQDRTAQYHDGLRTGKIMLEENIKHRHQFFTIMSVTHSLINTSPFGVHDAMFIPTIQLQGNLDQQAHWLPLARSGAILGAYCQTEIGHGTFLRGLETTARFDAEADKFIIHSPTPSSTKYWPGGLGHSASHAIVMARLVIHEKDHGVHAFLVQLRSLEDWKPMPGIELGDIGLLLGMNGANNGYARFDHVRIPRQNMMMGQAKVARNGDYTPPSKEHAKSSYSTMIYARALVAYAAAFQLAKACTIAIRYSTVREQGNLSFDAANIVEKAIITFKSQHYRLLLHLSRAYAIHFASRSSLRMCEDLVWNKDSKSQSMLAYLHITTAGLKAYGTQVAADGAEDARRCCGGHGYSLLSGLPNIVTELSSNATLEGENYVMYQQTARYLVKQAKLIREGDKENVDENVAYLQLGYEHLVTGKDKGCPYSADKFLDCKKLLDVFRHRAVRGIFDCEEALRTSRKNGRTGEEAWNEHMIQLIMAARYHLEYYILEAFIHHASEIHDQKVRRVIEYVCRLYALTTIESPLSMGSSGFIEDGYVSSDQLRAIGHHVNITLEALLPEAIGLTDAWNFSDASLQSALGRWDGNVYETLLEWTRQLPINRRSRMTGGVEVEGYQKYIKPIIAARSKL
ncbi:Peroxisomal acyl-coenzyme A oxidase 1 [Leucoagaricus sp. SymC.cos]|nr:Peroxisomal acyl-coenzyme A oxidase 1 [Leucoagaricus sp. SymC.cos]